MRTATTSHEQNAQPPAPPDHSTYWTLAACESSCKHWLSWRAAGAEAHGEGFAGLAAGAVSHDEFQLQNLS